MKIGVLGTGYVGLIAALGFAEKGHQVTGYDIDTKKVDMLNGGLSPIHEEGLKFLLPSLLEQKLHGNSVLGFTTDLNQVVNDAEIVFACLPTPSRDPTDSSVAFKVLSEEEIKIITTPLPGWRSDTRILESVFDQVAALTKKELIFVTKSTVPPGTAAGLYERLTDNEIKKLTVVSNPETLREGTALKDFRFPDRIISGYGGNGQEHAKKVIESIYEKFLQSGNPHFQVSWETAEMAKLSANFLLALKICGANAVANVCEGVGADYKETKKINSHDKRLGKEFYHAGPGYGGSCFPKDIKELAYEAHQKGLDTTLLLDAWKQNELQKHVLPNKVLRYAKRNALVCSDGPPLTGLKVALWGLAFKPSTDDIREAPSLTTLYRLLEMGAEVDACDQIPEARGKVRALVDTYRPEWSSRLRIWEDPYACLKDADCLVTVTEESIFDELIPQGLNLMRHKKIIDGRNRYSMKSLVDQGFDYEGVGRKMRKI